MPDKELLRMVDVTGRLRYKLLRDYARARSRAEFTDQFAHPVLASAALCEGSIGEQRDHDKGSTMAFDLDDLNPAKADEEEDGESGELQRSIYPLFKTPVSPAEPAVYSIGRIQGNDFMMVDFTISRRHAQIKAFTSAQYTITDCGSMNGTTLNDQRLEANQETPLAAGNKLRFGRFQFFFLAPMLLYLLLRKD